MLFLDSSRIQLEEFQVSCASTTHLSLPLGFSLKSSSAVSQIAVGMTQLTTTLLPRPGWFLDRSGLPGLSGTYTFSDLLLGSRQLFLTCFYLMVSPTLFLSDVFVTLWDYISVTGTHLRSEFSYLLGTQSMCPSMNLLTSPSGELTLHSSSFRLFVFTLYDRFVFSDLLYFSPFVFQYQISITLIAVSGYLFFWEDIAIYLNSQSPFLVGHFR